MLEIEIKISKIQILNINKINYIYIRISLLNINNYSGY